MFQKFFTYSVVFLMVSLQSLSLVFACAITTPLPPLEKYRENVSSLLTAVDNLTKEYSCSNTKSFLEKIIPQGLKNITQINAPGNEIENIKGGDIATKSGNTVTQGQSLKEKTSQDAFTIKSNVSSTYDTYQEVKDVPEIKENLEFIAETFQDIEQITALVESRCAPSFLIFPENVTLNDGTSTGKNGYFTKGKTVPEVLTDAKRFTSYVEILFRQSVSGIYDKNYSVIPLAYAGFSGELRELLRDDIIDACVKEQPTNTAFAENISSSQESGRESRDKQHEQKNTWRIKLFQNDGEPKVPKKPFQNQSDLSASRFENPYDTVGDKNIFELVKERAQYVYETIGNILSETVGDFLEKVEFLPLVSRHTGDVEDLASAIKNLYSVYTQRQLLVDLSLKQDPVTPTGLVDSLGYSVSDINAIMDELPNTMCNQVYNRQATNHSAHVECEKFFEGIETVPGK